MNQTCVQSVCVLGLGYIGLPTASMFAKSGINVLGVDVNQRVVDTLRSGRIHIKETGLKTVVQRAVNSGTLQIGVVPAPADAFIIAVPTPSRDDHSPNLRYVHAAAEAIVPHLRPGNLVILESTSPPGTTLSLIPILEKSGLTAGADFLLAHSPERVLPGRILVELVQNDRVVGGHTYEAAEACATLYRAFVTANIHLTDATTAEMAKLMENTFRDVNIALANELSRIGATVGINVYEAIRLANFHPRVNILRPGPGVGGHCIAVDPWFIVNAAPKESTLIRTARQVNDEQPGYVVDLVEKAVSHIVNPSIAVLGIAYKAEVDDVRESPAVEVVAKLRKRGYNLRLHDAYARQLPDGTPFESELAVVVKDAHAILILTDHVMYKRLVPSSPELLGLMDRIIIDARYCLNAQEWRLEGYSVHQLGVAPSARATELERVS